MRKLFGFSLYSLLILFGNLLVACNEPITKDYSIPNKTYEEFYDDLRNTTIEMEVVFQDKRASFFYSNDENFYVSTIKYENAQEFGFIYDCNKNILYTVDKGQISYELSSAKAEEQMEKIYQSANFLFYLKFDKSRFVFQELTTIADRNCSKYLYEDTKNNMTYIIYIDNETSLCLKCVSIADDSIEVFFETRKFLSAPNISNYTNLVKDYTSKNDNTSSNNKNNPNEEE